jgi:uncharacterized protein
MIALLLSTTLLFAADPASEAVELKTPTGTLYGVLDLPAGPGPWPVILIHAGSGPTDRDGNSSRAKNDSLKQLGEGLAAKGFACLRFDKRGIAKSTPAGPKEEELRITQFADDVVLWAKWLRADKRFGKLGFIGHSEGSLIGSLAAEAKFDAFVSLCGPGRKLSVVLREQLKKNLPKELFAKADAAMTELEAGRETKETPKELATLFRPSVQPYLISMIKPDPAKELGAVTCPVLVVSGTTDIQVSEDDSQALSAVRKGVQSVRIENMNHVLKEISKTSILLQDAYYKDPKYPLHPKLIDELTGFFEKTFEKKK